MNRDQRTEAREPLALPVKLGDGAVALTQDISASGLFFRCDGDQRVGDAIAFEIELQTPDGPMKLVAKGQIVRVETQGQQTGVGVKITESQLLSV